MSEFAKEILPINLEDEMRQSYLDYAMSVIVGRALPDVRDGLKPVHRRSLYAMNELSNDWNKAYKKSARIVGDVIGKYHPHGDSAVYESIVRMAQPFSLRYMLVNGQGNFGSVDGDPPAAMRYTEIRMQRIAHEMMMDIDKETVDFIPNYDGSETEPSVLPTRIPALLINGSTGIAVGMATNIPPHHLGETIDGCLALLANPEITIAELMQHIPGPDFPTAGIINGVSGIHEAYHTGRGRVIIRARAVVEHDESRGRDVIVITELPYQVNKARLVEKISELYRDKTIQGIAQDGLRDESDKDGTRVVIEMQRNESGEVLLNKLYQLTQLQTSFGINMVAIANGQPHLMNLKEVLQYFIKHRREVVTRRTIYELRKARERSHILEGLAIALANIDEIIQIIRSSSGSQEARERLLAHIWQVSPLIAQMVERSGADFARPTDLPADFGIIDGGYKLSPAQAQAILDLRLHRLTGLEQEKIHAEFTDLLTLIGNLLDILTRAERLQEVIQEELLAIKNQYNDTRRSEIRAAAEDISMKDLIAEENVVVTLSHRGYAKYQSLSDYQEQRRGGRGKSAARVKDEDYVDHLLVVSTHAQLMCFSSIGKVYWMNVYDLPEAGRGSAGRPIINLLPLAADERITSILAVEDYAADKFIFMATSQGVVKKTSLDKFASQRSSGLIAVSLDEDDQLIGTAITDGKLDVMLFASGGRVNRFNEADVRATGRGARGVRGITLNEGEKVISMIIPTENGVILTATENGYGKRTRVEDFTPHKRGGKGMIGIKSSERNGAVIGSVLVEEEQGIMLISSNGVLVRTRVAEISILGRSTQGVRLIRLDETDKLVGIAVVDQEETDETASLPEMDAEDLMDETDDSEADSDENSEEDDSENME